MPAGILLSVNSYIGKQEIFSFESQVYGTSQSTSRAGKKHYYITVKIPNEERKVELKVQKPYQSGELYKGKLYKGSLDMYYN